MVNIIQLLTTTLIYAVLGISSLFLAIPPGYASPVFPAAGLAIALALHFGNRILPGIWLGRAINYRRYGPGNLSQAIVATDMSVTVIE